MVGFGSVKMRNMVKPLSHKIAISSQLHPIALCLHQCTLNNFSFRLDKIQVNIQSTEYVELKYSP